MQFNFEYLHLNVYDRARIYIKQAFTQRLFNLWGISKKAI